METFSNILLLASIPALILMGLAFFVGIPRSPWVNIRERERKLFLKEIEIPKDAIVYDLGCGDASFLIQLQKQYDAQVYGVENFIIPFVLAKLKTMGNTKANIRFENLYETDLSKADYIYFFLLPEMYPKLIKKLANEIQEDTTVIAMCWPLNNIQPDIVIEKEGVLPICLYSGSKFKGYMQ